MSNKSSFLEIINSWPEYFEDMNEGLGTTYERFILHRYFERLRLMYSIDSVLEAPAFGMTGVSDINSLWWSANGIVPIVLDDNKERIEKSQKVWDSIPLAVDLKAVDDFYHFPVNDNSVDFSWNFASLWFVEDTGRFFKEINRVTKKVVFICVPNYYGIGYKLRALTNSMDIPAFFPDNIKSKQILKNANKMNWQLIEKGYLDIPPWPDIAMKKEVLFSKLGLSFLLNDKNEQDEDKAKRTCIVDYFNNIDPNLENKILKYSYLEKSPLPIKQIWGHHRYYIFEK